MKDHLGTWIGGRDWVCGTVRLDLIPEVATSGFGVL